MTLSKSTEQLRQALDRLESATWSATWPRRRRSTVQIIDVTNAMSQLAAEAEHCEYLRLTLSALGQALQAFLAGDKLMAECRMREAAVYEERSLASRHVSLALADAIHDDLAVGEIEAPEPTVRVTEEPNGK